MSYFNIYFNLRGERTLRCYSQPVDLSRFDDRHWMTSERSIWFIAEYLCTIPHTALLTPTQARELTRLDQRSRTAEMVGHRKKEKRSAKSLQRYRNSMAVIDRRYSEARRDPERVGNA